MLVCLCYGVSDRHVKQMMSEGVSTLEQIQAKLKVGENCGSCLCEIERIIQENKGNKNTPPIIPNSTSKKHL